MAKASTTIHQRFTRAYVIALATIAVCSLASFGVLHYSISAIESDARTIRVAGHQVTLVERAALLISALEADATQAERRYDLAQLEKVVAELEADHAALIGGDPARGLPGIQSEAVRHLYFSFPHHTDKVFNIFLDQVRGVAASARAGDLDSAAARATATLGRVRLAIGLGKILARYEAEANQRVRQSRFVHFGILVVTLSLLAAVALFIFRPAARAIEEQTRRVMQSRAEIDHAAHHDALTGVANRHYCEELIGQSIAQIHEMGGNLAVLHLNLDGFKSINETRGHAAGDDALWRVANRLKEVVRDEDRVARLGGDEFMVVCPGIGRPCDPAAIASRIMAAFSEPFVLQDGVPLEIACTIGVGVFPDDAMSVSDLLIAADLALRRAKAEGKSRFVMFDQAMRDEFNHKVELTGRVKRAIDEGEFEVFYQPQVEFETGRIVGVEALVRWRDPDIGLRLPGEFLDFIERSDGLQELSSFIMDRAIADAANWHRKGIEFGRLGINITAGQLRDPDFIDNLLDRLFAHGLPPAKVAVEILESAVISNHNRRLRVLLDELNDLDISVEFDDFGTGYASLMHLRDLPVNRIKIDRTFVSDLPENRDHANIVRGVINIVGQLNLDMVAEGVETVEQARILAAWGCSCGQGFLFASPAPFRETTDYLWLADYKRALDAISSEDNNSGGQSGPDLVAAS